MKNISILMLLLFTCMSMASAATAGTIKESGADSLGAGGFDYTPPGELTGKWVKEDWESLFPADEYPAALKRKVTLSWERKMLGNQDVINWQNPEKRPPGIGFVGWSGVGSPATSTVPVPGAIWLLGAGLVGLIGFRSQAKSNVRH